MKTNNIKSICITAVFAAVICILAPISIPSGAVPLSLSTLAVLIAAGMLECKNSVGAVLIYILLGAVGLPVFSSFTGGFQKLVGVTGGYIIGYIPLAFIVSFLVKKCPKKWMYPLSMVLGTVVLYTFGTAWFVFQTKTDIASALAACVVPFIFGDALKITAASAICALTRKRLGQYLSR